MYRGEELFIFSAGIKEQNFGFFGQNIVEISVIGEPRNEIANR